MALFDTTTYTISLKSPVNKKLTLNFVSNNATIFKISSKKLAEYNKNIEDLANKHLYKYKDDCEIINTEERLLEYIQNINENGIYAIDTETTGLNVQLDELVGISIYTPNEKAVYIPITHKSILTFKKIPNQLSKEVIINSFEKINAKCLMWNANFDIRVLYYSLGIKMKCDWDGFIAEKLLINGKTKLSAALKKTYSRYMNLEQEMLNFDSYFGNLTFDYVNMKQGYIYAALDAKLTYETYLYQIKEYENKPELLKLLNDIELPLLNVVVNIENRGIKFDTNHNDYLKIIYKKDIEKLIADLDEMLLPYTSRLNDYRIMNPKGLSNPINYNSPAQISILLYDVLGAIELEDDSRKKETGEKILKEINTPFTLKLLEYREAVKLYTTYIDKLDKLVINGKIHTVYNQLGAETGRFSSESPNLQNIPNKEGLRQVFTADENKLLISADYSGQEPRIATCLCKDPIMIEAYKEGKDFYAFLGSKAYHIPYERCLESYKEYDSAGNLIYSGKKVREICKRVFLAICYGMGIQHMAFELNVDVSEAKKALEAIYNACPGLLKLKEDSIRIAKQFGYITTYYNRIRYIENINLKRYTFKYDNKYKIPFDPLDFTEGGLNNSYLNDIEESNTKKLLKANTKKQFEYIIKQLKEEGITVIDNSGYIAEAERKAVNTRVQGTAADMIKRAMILIDKDEELKKYGFELLLTVHDEVIGQFNEQYKKEVSKRLEELMLLVTKDLEVPFKCDITISQSWGGKAISL